PAQAAGAGGRAGRAARGHPERRPRPLGHPRHGPVPRGARRAVPDRPLRLDPAVLGLAVERRPAAGLPGAPPHDRPDRVAPQPWSIAALATILRVLSLAATLPAALIVRRIRRRMGMR